MKYRIVQKPEDGPFDVIEFEAADVPAAIVAAEALGFEARGLNSNPNHRDELQGQPQFKGVLGPMFDGGAIRYENAAAYRHLSA